MITSNYSTARYNLYENDGQGNFSGPIVYNASTAGSCVILHDRDNDGDMDITGIDEVDDLIFLFENDSTLTDIDETISNPKAILGQSFPNPARDRITINYTLLKNESTMLNIYNELGAIVSSYELDFYKKSIDIQISTNKPGVYIYGISIQGINASERKTFVVE